MHKVKYNRKEYRSEYLKSDEWRNLRETILSSQPLCQCCNLNKASEVHHMVYRNIVDVKISDLLPVCRRCHNFIHKAIQDGYISQDADKVEEIKKITPNILQDEGYQQLRKWLSVKHVLSECEINIIVDYPREFIIRRMRAILKRDFWYNDLPSLKVTGRQLLEIRKLIKTAVFRQKNPELFKGEKVGERRFKLKNRGKIEQTGYIKRLQDDNLKRNQKRG